MKLGIMQPYFFPYIGYWQLIHEVDIYVIYDDVNFINRGWINRNNILINNNAKLINLQLQKVSQNKLINEIEIFDKDSHNKKLLKTIESAYKKAPYFDYAFPLIETIIKQSENNLGKFLTYSIKEICNYLGIETKLILSSQINKNTNLRGQNKIIDICKILGANEYINAIGGKSLYSIDEFSLNGIQLKFLRTEDIMYQQFTNEFVPSLSVIDIMMFNSQEKINQIINNYKLI